MQALEVSPAGASSATLLHALQRAHHRSHGVLLLEMDQCSGAAAEIRELLDQRDTAAQQAGGSVQVRPLARANGPHRRCGWSSDAIKLSRGCSRLHHRRLAHRLATPCRWRRTRRRPPQKPCTASPAA